MRGNLGKFILFAGLVVPIVSGPGLPRLHAQPVKAAVPLDEPATPEERELQQLLKQLTATGETLLKNVQAPDAWKLQVQQADLLLQIAYRSKGIERENFLRMSVQTYHSAAVQSPDNEPGSLDRLRNLPGQIRQHFPASTLYIDAALQLIRAEHARKRTTTPAEQTQAQLAFVERLLQFAQEYPAVRESVAAIQEAARIAESLGKNEIASRCHRLLADKNPGTEAARQARMSLRQLGGLDGEVVRLQLPLLYPTATENDAVFDLKEVEGKLVVLFFWSSETPEVSNSFEAMKKLTDRFRSRDLAVVYVNMDANPEKGREFLQGRLVTGTHVVLKGGLTSAFAEKYGVVKLPEAFLLNITGSIVAPSLTPTQIEAAVAAQLTGAGRRK